MGAVQNDSQTSPKSLIQVASISQNFSKSCSWGEKKTPAFKYSHIREIQSYSGYWGALKSL